MPHELTQLVTGYSYPFHNRWRNAVAKHTHNFNINSKRNHGLCGGYTDGAIAHGFECYLLKVAS